MMPNCTHDCGSCSANCGERRDAASFKKPAHKESHIRKVIGVVSGKGGVGKSMVTSLLAVALRRAGKQVAILDADVTGPSIPRAFGLRGHALMTDRGVFPMETRMGIKVMSINLLLQNETDPVVWRGPVIAGAIQQFWTDVIYGDVDFLLVDMPPGTGDVPLTVFQTMPVDGIIVVASPQELVGMIVEKACNMAKMMDVPVLSIVENFSYFKCPGCGQEHALFGKSRLTETAAAHDVTCQDKLPIDPALAEAADSGKLEETNAPYLQQTTDLLLKML
ncbi:MAG: Mrp/NBP35 family ATP-binding protein [Acidaminococcaceae bacterium]|nr:Mrp/NBP35 family ATP-binding protein [Acidaminococcaceae bacterium]